MLAADLGAAFTLPGIDAGEDAADGAAEPEGARAVPVRRRRLRATGRGDCTMTSPYLTRYLLHVFKTAADLKLPGRCRHARARLYVPRAVARGRTADQRRMVARLHGVAGVRGQGARRRRTQPGLEPDPALRLPRPDAGVRAGLPARRAWSRSGRQLADCARPHRRPAPPHAERHSAGSRQRPRRGAERSVPALVLELERALDRDRAELDGAGKGGGRAGARRWCAG